MKDNLLGIQVSKNYSGVGMSLSYPPNLRGFSRQGISEF